MELFQVTLKRGEDIDAFYDDMETPGGAITIPDRKVECEERRPTSRTTGYMLTLEEAQEVSYDDRVEVVVPQSVLDRQTVVKDATYNGRFTKSTSPTGSTFTNANGDTRVTYTNNDHYAWGILRHIESTNRSGWGNDAGSSSGRRVDDTVTYSASGKNVDIVIVDNYTLSDHAEYSSRLIDYNWGQHYNTITGGTNYTYSNADARDNFSAEDTHPTASASYAAGERFGLANDANVYMLDLTYERSKSGGNSNSRAFAYIREFHANKSINPATGRKNPTIVNVSLGTINTYSGASVAHFQGVTLDKGNGSTFLTDAELSARGVYKNAGKSWTTFTSNTNFQVNSPSPDSDLVDAIAEGVIVVTSGGNNNRYTDISGGDNYDNYLITGAAYVNKDYFFNGYYPFRDYYMRGDNFSFNGAINIGALSNDTDEGKADFSNWGPGIDVYAAGESVMGAMMKDDINFGNPYYGQENNVGTWDTMGVQNGTSYASPFIAGMLACLAEVYPTLTNDQARTYLRTNAVTGLMADTGGTSTDWSPTEVSGSTAVWVDASDTGSYTTSGSNVTAVTDKTGTFTFGITGTPNVSNTLDGKNVITFSSSESIQSTNEAAQTDALGNHWAIGLMQWNNRNDSQDSFWSTENNTVGSGKRDYAISAGASGFAGELDLDGLSSNRISSTIGNKQDFDSSIAQNTWVIIVAIFNKTGNQIAVRVNGENKFTPVNDYDNALNQNMDIRFFRNRANERMGGRMAEFISFAGMPGLGGTDVSEVERMEGYLAHKWGQQSSLPSSHPYKSSAPATNVLTTDTSTKVTLDGSDIDRIALWKNHRATSGNMAFNTYNKNVNDRPTSGLMYPRKNTRIHKHTESGGGGSSISWGGDRAIVWGSNGGTFDGEKIDYFDITTPGNATNFGDVHRQVDGWGPGKYNGTCVSDTTYGVYAGGNSSHNLNNTDQIDYITISTPGNSADFGSLTLKQPNRPAGGSDGTTGFFAGGSNDYANYYWTGVHTVSIATPGNATLSSFALSTGTYNTMGTNDATRMLIFGGFTNGSTNDDFIQYLTFASAGTAQTFGNLAQDRGNGAAASDGSIALVGGGYNIGTTTILDNVETVTIQTPGNATTFGDLSQAGNRVCATANTTYGVFSGGDANATAIDQFTFATASNATDHGDLAGGGQAPGCCSGSAS